MIIPLTLLLTLKISHKDNYALSSAKRLSHGYFQGYEYV